jgi:hypothetical protein
MNLYVWTSHYFGNGSVPGRIAMMAEDEGQARRWVVRHLDETPALHAEDILREIVNEPMVFRPGEFVNLAVEDWSPPKG